MLNKTSQRSSMLLRNLARRNYRGGYWDFFRRVQDLDDVMDRQMRLMERDFERFRRSMFQDFGNRLASSDESNRDMLASGKEGGEISEQSKSDQPQRFSRSDSQSEIYVNGTRIRQHIYDSIKERDGQMIPFQKKEVYCEPPCDLKTLEQYSKLQETVDDKKEQQMLTEFMNEAKQKGIEPQKIMSFKNLVEYDPSDKKKRYTINVNYIDKDGDRMQYKFSRKEGEEPKTKIYALQDREQLDWDQQTRKFLEW